MVAAAVSGFHDAEIAATAEALPRSRDTNWTAPPAAGDPALPVPVEQAGRAAVRRGHRQGRRRDYEHARRHAKLDPSERPGHALQADPDRAAPRQALDSTGRLDRTAALDMAGVAKRYDGEIAVRAIRRGVDLLLMPPDYPEAYQAVLAR